MHLADLYLYPIKSCAPLAVDAAVVEPRGLRGDRRWLVVDDDARFVTGREVSRLLLVRAAPRDGGGLALEAPGMRPLVVHVPREEARMRVTVWHSAVDALPAAAEADAWLTEFLRTPVRLVHMDTGAHRAVAPEYGQPGDEVSFADGMPMLLLSQASLDGLNARLEVPVPMQRFRPNLVVDGAAPHAEDGWRQVRIGGIDFDVVKPCVRCVLTTVDPVRGERDPSGEPLRTLVGYRRSAMGVTFGQNLIPRGAGTLRRGDAFEVLA